MRRTTVRQAGLTMVELMAVIAILAAILALAVPGYQELIRNNRQISEVYALRSTLANARSEALTRRAPVVVCPTTNGDACANTTSWGEGYMSFVDSNDDNAPDPNDPNEERIQWEVRDSLVDVQFDNDEQRVRFAARGTALGFEGIFTFCDDRGTEGARGLILNAVGSVRSAADPNDPDPGDPWSCP